MNLERRVAFIERAIQCLRCSQGNSTNFGGITPTFTNLTASDIGATSTSTPEDIRQLLSDYIAVNPIIIGQNEIRYVQVDGNTYVIQNTLPGVISIVQPEDFIQISSLNKNFGTTAGTVAEGNHTHNSILNQNGGTSLKFWVGTQAQHDAIVTKDTTTIYNII